MITKQIISFLVRWVVSSFGMWLCINTFGKVDPNAAASYDLGILGHMDIMNNIGLFVVAGFIFSIVNSIIKPLVTIFALPFIIWTIGLFSVVVNAAMFAFTIWLLPEIQMPILGIVMSTLVMSSINILANSLIPAYNRR